MHKLLLALTVSLFATGCASDSNQPSPAQPLTRIGVIAPLNGGLTEFGRGIRNSVQLAVNQANARLGQQYFEVAAFDDSSTPEVGRAAAETLVRDPQVVGVVGTYNSGVAAVAAPILQTGNVVMISPGNTDPALTNPRRFPNYFRLVVPDTIQGAALATHAFDTLNARNVAIVSQNKTVSLALVDAFQSEFARRGGNIVRREVVPDGTTDFSAILPNLQAANPELIVYGGELDTAAPFRQQASAAGLTVPLMGSDGIKSEGYISSAGAASNGDFASSVGAPPESQPGGAQFLQDYRNAGFSEPPSDFGPYAYDAANLIIGAVTRQGYDRSAIVADVQAANTSGVTGPIAFDSFGDTRNRVLTIYQVQSGVFVPLNVLRLP